MRFISLFFLFGFGFFFCTSAQDAQSYTSAEIIYGRKDGMALTMTMLTPKQNPNGRSIISVVSGNWISTYDNVPRFITRAKKFVDNGYTVFVVMHGSQPRYNIIDEVADLKRAVRFIRFNAPFYKIDPNKIGITGSSSGGHLSLMVGLTDDNIDTTAKDPVNRMSSKVQAVGVFFPPVDFFNYGPFKFTDVNQLKAIMSGFGVASAFDFRQFNDTTRSYQLITNTDKIVELVKQVSPINAVNAGDPPVLLIHGDADRVVPLQQSEILLKKLKEANIPSDLIIKKGADHGWVGIDVEEQNFVSWFNKYLK